MKTLIATIALLGLASVAAADEKHGPYIGAGIGQTNVKADEIEDLGPILDEFDTNATSFKVFGGWRFNRYFAAELDYLDFGSPEDDVSGVHVKTEFSGFAPYATGSIPIGPVELFAKVGYLFYDIKVEAGGQKVSAASGSHDDFIYGIGAGITLFQHLQAQLEYEVVDVSKTFNHADAVWISAAWRF